MTDSISARKVRKEWRKSQPKGQLMMELFVVVSLTAVILVGVATWSLATSMEMFIYWCAVMLFVTLTLGEGWPYEARSSIMMPLTHTQAELYNEAIEVLGWQKAKEFVLPLLLEASLHIAQASSEGVYVYEPEQDLFLPRTVDTDMFIRNARLDGEAGQLLEDNYYKPIKRYIAQHRASMRTEAARLASVSADRIAERSSEIEEGMRANRAIMAIEEATQAEQTRNQAMNAAYKEIEGM